MFIYIYIYIYTYVCSKADDGHTTLVAIVGICASCHLEREKEREREREGERERDRQTEFVCERGGGGEKEREREMPKVDASRTNPVNVHRLWESATRATCRARI